MDNRKIDEAILAVAESRRLKVARILVDAARVPGVGVPETDEGFEIIRRRVEVLVEQGRFLAWGNLEEPRYSEVCLPSAPEDDKST